MHGNLAFVHVCDCEEYQNSPDSPDSPDSPESTESKILLMMTSLTGTRNSREIASRTLRRSSTPNISIEIGRRTRSRTASVLKIVVFIRGSEMISGMNSV